MKKLTYIACLFASASFGMNGSSYNVNDHLTLSASIDTNSSRADNLSSMLLTSLTTSEEYFADAESLASSVDMEQLYGTTLLSEYVDVLPDGTINNDNIVANESNTDVTTMTLRINNDVNTYDGFVLSGQNVFNIDNTSTNAMSEDSLSADEGYTENDDWYFVDGSSSSSDGEIDFFNLSSSISSFEFM